MGGGNGSSENETGASYASFSINLPTTSGTRAAGDPDFTPGDANEYKVMMQPYSSLRRGNQRKKGKHRKKVIILSLRVQSWVQWHHGKIQMRQV